MKDAEPIGLSIITPAYNEEENLAWVLPVLLTLLDRHGETYELVVIDDGSRDGTAGVVEQLARVRPQVRLVRHPRNLGSGSAFYTGIREARGTYMMMVPADLAVEPDDLPRFFDAATACDVVVGVRSDRRDYTLARKLVSHVNIFLIKTLFLMRLRQYNYVYLFRRSIFETVRPRCRSVFLGAEILILARDRGLRLVEVEARYLPRRHGQATCGNPRVILRTVRDMLRFWARWALGW